MSPSIPKALLDTILGRLALLFLAGACGDLAAARAAANQTLAAYNVKTEHELTLAAEIISFSLLALEALGQSADASLSINQILRLRGSAVSMSRESHKAQRKLDQLQRQRQAAAPPADALPEPTEAQKEQAAELVAVAHQVIQATKRSSGKTWSKDYQARQTAKRITETLRKKQAEHERQAARNAA